MMKFVHEAVEKITEMSKNAGNHQFIRSPGLFVRTVFERGRVEKRCCLV